jgi:hypothetical protein
MSILALTILLHSIQEPWLDPKFQYFHLDLTTWEVLPENTRGRI